MEPNYGNWILSKDFGVQVKNIIRKLMKEHEQLRRNG
jgi:hypothetical protein